MFLQEIKTGRQAKARDSMPEGGPRDLTLSESLASKLLDIECTLEEDWTDVEDPDKLGESTPCWMDIWDWRWCQQLAKKVYVKLEGVLRDKWSTSGNALLSVGTGGDWGEVLVVSGLVGGELVDRTPSPTWEECSFEMRVVAAVEGAIWASLLGLTDSPWLASGSAIRGPSIPFRLGFISSSWCSISSWCSALGTWTKMSSVVGIWSASSIGPIWLSSKGGWGAARFGPTSVPDVLGACVKVEI